MDILMAIVGIVINTLTPLVERFNHLPAIQQYQLVGALLGLALLIYLADRALSARSFKRVLLSDPGIPKELLHGKLISSESPIACRSPRKMHGTPDRVYKTSYGGLLPVDVKTRRSQRVQQTDVVQLSVYAQILKKKGAVEDYGYIRFDHPPTPPVYKKVALLSTAQVCNLYDRHKAVAAGNIEPLGAKHIGMCKGCGHQSRCDKKPI